MKHFFRQNTPDFQYPKCNEGLELGLNTQARTSSSQLRYDVDISHANQANPHRMLAQKTHSNFEDSGEESASLTQLQANT